MLRKSKNRKMTYDPHIITTQSISSTLLNYFKSSRIVGYPTTLATTLTLMNSSVVPSVVGHNEF